MVDPGEICLFSTTENKGQAFVYPTRFLFQLTKFSLPEPLLSMSLSSVSGAKKDTGKHSFCLSDVFSSLIFYFITLWMIPYFPLLFYCIIFFNSTDKSQNSDILRTSPIQGTESSDKPPVLIFHRTERSSRISEAKGVPAKKMKTDTSRSGRKISAIKS